eukprot:gene5681-biopygen10279
MRYRRRRSKGKWSQTWQYGTCTGQTRLPSPSSPGTPFGPIVPPRGRAVPSNLRSPSGVGDTAQPSGSTGECQTSMPFPRAVAPTKPLLPVSPWSSAVRSGPVRSGPVRSGPAGSGPVRCGAVRSGPDHVYIKLYRKMAVPGEIPAPHPASPLRCIYEAHARRTTRPRWARGTRPARARIPPAAENPSTDGSLPPFGCGTCCGIAARARLWGQKNQSQNLSEFWTGSRRFGISSVVGVRTGSPVDVFGSAYLPAVSRVSLFARKSRQRVGTARAKGRRTRPRTRRESVTELRGTTVDVGGTSGGHATVWDVDVDVDVDIDVGGRGRGRERGRGHGRGRGRGCGSGAGSGPGSGSGFGYSYDGYGYGYGYGYARL